MPSQDPDTTLRNRSGPPKTLRTPADLAADHPEIEPVVSSSTVSGSTHKGVNSSASPSVASRIFHILLKPFYFILFALLHILHELAVSLRSMKTYVQVFIMAHKFPTSPGVVRVFWKDLGTDLAKKPKHLAVILPAASTSDGEEEEWHSRVSQLAQWSVASGIKCLSVMRTDDPEFLELLKERIDYELKEFYKEEKVIPEVRVRALRPVENSLDFTASKKSKVSSAPQARAYDLDVVILAEADGHDRLAANVRALGEAALHKEIQSQDITMDFLDRQLSSELSEPELLIVFKDDLDLSSYPPWHIRLTEI
ncbi:hypothetical protein BGZ79_008824 [Entomortierella chlamydospora]|nr:hypothetical protein BGZ79_008824 [Entomortierella chlamydospora]